MQEQNTKAHARVFQTYKSTDPAVQNLFGDSSVINQYIWAEKRPPLKGNARLATANVFASGCSMVEMTRYLTGIFQADLNKPSIFASGNPDLFSLVQVLLDSGWHPNQILGPPQEIALHHVQCVQDTNILKLLLEHGADPTIARKGYASLIFHRHPSKAPVQRKVGDVLDIAAKLGSTKAVDLLLAHGAKFEYGRALHCLIEFNPQKVPCVVLHVLIWRNTS
ncbi:ankyrin [Apiospora saccharicola]